jgi:predicted RecA/RadA family phage recombinase
MAEAVFKQGDPIMVDHTPSGAVAAGEVVVTGDSPRIAHRPIAAGVLGALAAAGGVYKVPADGAIAADKKVYWDNTANKVTLTSTSNKGFGTTVEAAAADGDLIHVLHRPF